MELTITKDIIRALMKESGFENDRRGFCDKTGLHPATLKNYLDGNSHPNLNELNNILARLNLKIAAKFI